MPNSQPTAPLLDIDVVTVLYKSGDSIGEALATLPSEAHLWLVENLPGDGSVEAALGVRPDATVLRPNANIGFGAACNLAIGASKAPYILLLNPDAKLEPHCLEQMVRAMDAQPDVAGVGPLVLRSDDGTIDSAGMIVLAPGWTADRLRGHSREMAPPSGPVECLSGGVLLLRREALLQCGRHPDAFWADFFLYSEDVELSLTLRKAGWSLLYLREAVALHAVGASTTDRTLIRSMCCRNRIVTGLVHATALDFFSPKVWSRWGWRALMDWRQMLNNLRIPQLRHALPNLVGQIPGRRRRLRQMKRRQAREISG